MRRQIAALTIAGALMGLVPASGQAPVIAANGVVQAASYTTPVAEGTVISIFGTNLAGTTQAMNGLPLPTSLAGVTVEVVDNGQVLVAPLYFVSPGQINAQLPYGLSGGPIQVRVRTAQGLSNSVGVAVGAGAPALFTFSQLGTGRVAAQNAITAVNISGNTPAVSGQLVTAYAAGLGGVEPPIAAGQPAGDGDAGGPLNVVPAEAGARIRVGGMEADLWWAGLAPYFAGLYQLNFRMPYFEVQGDLALELGAAGRTSPAGVFIPSLANGFYITLPASKAPNGQALTGAAGAGSALALSHLGGPSWVGLGQEGLRAWSKNTGLGQTFAPITGLALTMLDGENIVYDNNGIEDGTDGGFYNNVGGGPDGQTAGLLSFFSNSVREAYVTAGYFRLSTATTITRIIGYFDGQGQLSVAPFYPSNFYNTYRMNIYSNGPGNAPAVWVDGFFGDMLSTDPAAPTFSGGTFSFSDTGLVRGFQGGATKPIFRLVYDLDHPVTLPAGEYWFSHDVAVPDAAAQSMARREAGAVSEVEARKARTAVRGENIVEVRPREAISTTP